MNTEYMSDTELRSQLTYERVVPSEETKRGWSAIATAAYSRDDNFTGTRYSVWCALPVGCGMEMGAYKTLQVNAIGLVLHYWLGDYTPAVRRYL
jgi:hypothetical protein